jgi:hypothetical protein
MQERSASPHIQDNRCSPNGVHPLKALGNFGRSPRSVIILWIFKAGSEIFLFGILCLIEEHVEQGVPWGRRGQGLLSNRGKVLAKIEPPFELFIKSGFVEQIVLEGEFQILFEKLGQHVAMLDNQVEKGNRQKNVLVFRFLYDNLGENKGGHIFFGPGVDYRNLAALPYDFADLFEGYVGALFGIVDPPVLVFSEHDFFVHCLPRIE